MTTTLLVSPPATGKTKQCIRHIQRTLGDQSLATVWVVLPDRLQAVAFRRCLAASGGAVGVHIGTFGDLYSEILSRAGHPVPVASVPIVHRLLRAAIHDVINRGCLTHYAAIVDKPGFLRALRERFAELKRAQVQPEALLAKSASRSRDLLELAEIYAAYQARIQRLGWADSEGLSWLAVEALEANPALCADWPLLVVDGFDAFYGAQLAALRLLSRTIPQVLVTLPGTPEMERAVHRRFVRSLDRLTTELGVTIEPLPATPHLPAPLTHLEQALFEVAANPRAGDGQFELLEMPSPAEEAREVLRWMKARIVRDNLRLAECALIVPDLDLYRPHLEAIASEFGLTLRFTKDEPLVSAPSIAALLDLLELPLRGFPHRLTLEAVRTPYLDLSAFGLTPQDAEDLDAVSRYGQVIEGLEQWEEAFTRLTAMVEMTPMAEDEADGPRRLVGGDAAQGLWRRLHGFAQRLEPPDSQGMRAWVRWLEELLEDLRFYDRAETERDRAASQSLRETLRALVLSEEVAGEAVLDYAGFVTDFRGSLEGVSLQQSGPWSAPAIQVLETLAARGVRYHAIAILGLSEGLFPKIEREDPLFSDALRQDLGLEPRLGLEQEGLFYQMITRADTYLLLTRPYLADDGERWEPSPYWDAVTSLVTDRPRPIRPDDPRPMADAASAQEALFWTVRRRSLPSWLADPLMLRWQHLRHARDVLATRQAKAPSGPFEGDLSRLAGSLSDRFGPGHVWSPSRLEVYGTCPFRFFAESALGLETKEPPEAGFDARQLGSMLHAILEQAYRASDDPADPEAVIAGLHSTAEAEFKEAPERYGFRPTALWTVEREQLLERLAGAIRGLAEVGSGWTPVAFEQAFGEGGIPALVMEAEGERIRLHGVIDRVDRSSDGTLRVVDYKTGSSHLERQDLIEGRRLQLPLYALAAGEVLGLGEPTDGLYWAILAGKAGSLTLHRFIHEDAVRQYQGSPGAIALALKHVARIVTGVRTGAFSPIPPRGGCPSYCAVRTWCWRYTPGR